MKFLILLLALSVPLQVAQPQATRPRAVPRQQAAQQQTLEGKCVGVHDGDTLTVLKDKEQFKIRLEEIDSPEFKQDYGTKAKTALSQKVFGKQIKVLWKEKDQYGRILGKVYIDKRWINRELVAEGNAWHYSRYSKDKTLEAAQIKAKKLKKGLWADPHAKPPWDFRKEDKKKAA